MAPLFGTLALNGVHVHRWLREWVSACAADGGLPPNWGHNRAAPIAFGPDTGAPLESPPESLDEARPIRVRTVLGGTPQSK